MNFCSCSYLKVMDFHSDDVSWQCGLEHPSHVKVIFILFWVVGCDCMGCQIILGVQEDDILVKTISCSH